MLVVAYQLQYQLVWLQKKQDTYLFIFKFDGSFSLQIQVFFFLLLEGCLGLQLQMRCFTVSILQGLLLRVCCAFFASVFRFSLRCFVPDRFEFFVPFLPF